MEWQQQKYDKSKINGKEVDIDIYSKNFHIQEDGIDILFLFLLLSIANSPGHYIWNMYKKILKGGKKKGHELGILIPKERYGGEFPDLSISSYIPD